MNGKKKCYWRFNVLRLVIHDVVRKYITSSLSVIKLVAVVGEGGPGINLRVS